MSDTSLPALIGLESQADVRQALKDLEIDLLILAKRIRVHLTQKLQEYALTLPKKISSGLKKIGDFFADAFRVDSLEDYANATALYGEELAASLYGLQRDFAGLKLAVLQAAAPVAQVLVPVIRLAVQAFTGLAQAIGYVLRMLFLGTAETEDFSAGVQGAVSAGKELKRSLAGFDEINRLADHTGSGAIGLPDISEMKPLSGNWKKLAEKLAQMLEPLKKIDLTPAAESLERLRKALEPITRALFEGLEWAWFNILVPLSQWAVEELLPAFLDSLTISLQDLGVVIEKLKPYFLWLWEECLVPWAEWKGTQIITDIQGVQGALGGITAWAGANQATVDSMIQSAKEWIALMGAMAKESMGMNQSTDNVSISIKEFAAAIAMAASPFQGLIASSGILSYSIGSLIDAFSNMKITTEGTMDAVDELAKNGWDALKQKFVDPATSGLEESCSKTSSAFSTMVRDITTYINNVTQAMNKITFTFPEWLPSLGGKTISFSFPKIKVPSVPALAKGAVLPANQPFMAVVGDQKHGTNVEAPLSVIQEAVSAVMADYAASNLAGHQATVSVLQELLAAVLGIRVGDDIIAGAVDRYERKMAVIQGGIG